MWRGNCQRRTQWGRRWFQCSAAVFAAGHDGCVEAVTKSVGQIVQLVGAIDLNGLAGRVVDHFAVPALVQVLFEFRAGLCGKGVVVDQLVEMGQEFSAGHLSALISPSAISAGPVFLWK